MTDRETDCGTRLPELRLLQESEEQSTKTVKKRKLYTGRTNAEGRASLPRTQTSESAYPFAFSIVPFENFGATNQPSAVGDAVFVIEAWDLIGIVGEGTSFQWSLYCDVQAKHKASPNNRVEGNLLEHGNYARELDVAVVVEYYVAT